MRGWGGGWKKRQPHALIWSSFLEYTLRGGHWPLNRQYLANAWQHCPAAHSCSNLPPHLVPAGRTTVLLLPLLLSHHPSQIIGWKLCSPILHLSPQTTDSCPSLSLDFQLSLAGEEMHSEALAWVKCLMCLKGQRTPKQASSAQPSHKRLVYDTYHSIDLCWAHHPRHFIKLFRRHGEQIFWRLEPGRVADRRRRGGTVLD